MKFLLASLLCVSSAYASDLCTRYENNTRYFTAIETVADYLGYELNQLCNHPSFLDIEVQPSRVITRNGEVQPHVKVQFHKNYESCYYKVRDEDKAITESRCYSTY
ncbi:MAG: hypothetical protein WDA09_05160 [Bacteriovoracaceae bacterium]